MRILSLSILLISLHFSQNVSAQNEMYKLNFLSQDRGASCLDGSPPAYYLHEGFGQNKHNYLIGFTGGGFCGQSTLSLTLESCYNRSNTNLGSSKKLVPEKSAAGGGIYSTDSSENEAFYDWTKIVFNYCDGSQYVGYRENPINFRDKNLYFRGSRNVKELFLHLEQKFDIYNGGIIITTGISAGGVASFEWTNWLSQRTKKAKVYALPDSGFFITDFYSDIVSKKMLRERAQPLLSLVYNETEMPEPIQKCMAIQGFDIVDCFNSANYAQFLKTPVFMIQSPYDAWSLQNILGAKCLTNKQNPYSLDTCDEVSQNTIQKYRKSSIQLLKSMKGSRRDVGVWGPACAQHGFSSPGTSYNTEYYTVNGITLMKAIQKFLNNPNEAPWLLDQIVWPNNKGCSGINNQKSQLRLEALSD